jgi:hypothetical protein
MYKGFSQSRHRGQLTRQINVAPPPDLDAILANVLLARASFPIKYLGLLLTPRRLKKLYFQPLFDKVAGNLSTWNARNLTQAGRASLVKFVLSSQLVYLLTVICLPFNGHQAHKGGSPRSGQVTKKIPLGRRQSHHGRQVQG